MRYLALASDYDGTLARDGVVSTETVEALERLREFSLKFEALNDLRSSLRVVAAVRHTLCSSSNRADQGAQGDDVESCRLLRSGPDPRREQDFRLRIEAQPRAFVAQPVVALSIQPVLDGGREHRIYLWVTPLEKETRN